MIIRQRYKVAGVRNAPFLVGQLNTSGYGVLLQPNIDPLLEKILAIEDVSDLHALGADLVSQWGLSAFEIILQEGSLRHVMARAGEPLTPAFETDGAGVAESEGVWSFALSDDEIPLGWLRVKLAGPPEAEIVGNLQRLSRWLRPALARLADRERIRSLENQMELLREQAQQADRLKEEFLSNLSHELRTPLTAILGFSEILIDRGELGARHAECVQRIHDNGHRLLQLLNRLIQLAKLESDRLNVNLIRIHPSSVVDSAIAALRAAAEAKGLRFMLQLEELPATFIDPQLFQQTLYCVLENAIKFTEQGQVRVRTWSDLSRLYVEVADTGRGIDASHIPYVFDAFWQGDGSMTRSVGGNGIGLTLASRLMHRMGGDIQVESSPGEGTTLQLALSREAPLRRENKRAHDKQADQFGLPFLDLLSARS